mgnify:CR=1 FL=1
MSKYDKGSFQALVDSGRIRYQAYPAGNIAIAADAAWDELWAAAAGPIVDYWICGFQWSVATAFAKQNHSQLIDFGWGGADGAAVAAANVVVTNFPVTITSVALALGPMYIGVTNLPYPVWAQAGSRAAARIAANLVAGVAFTEFRLICATAIGS